MSGENESLRTTTGRAGDPLQEQVEGGVVYSDYLVLASVFALASAGILLSVTALVSVFALASVLALVGSFV